jgi:hypothetical protein
MQLDGHFLYAAFSSSWTHAPLQSQYGVVILALDAIAIGKVKSSLTSMNTALLLLYCCNKQRAGLLLP